MAPCDDDDLDLPTIGKNCFDFELRRLYKKMWSKRGLNRRHLDLDGSVPPVEHAVSPRVGIILHPLQPFCAPAQLLWRHFLLQSDRVSRHRGRDTLWGHACQPWTPLPIVMVDKDKYTETKANTKIPRQIHKVPKGLTSFAFLEITILQNFMISL